MGTDAIVVGAGPSGLIASREIASKGFSVKLFEEHKTIGIPRHCSGLISVEGIHRLGLNSSVNFIQNEIRGGRIFTPDGRSLEIRDKRTRAYVIDRSKLDQYLAEKASEAGVEIQLGRKVEQLNLSGQFVMGAKGHEWVEKAPITINAEGPARRLLRESKLLTKVGKPLVGVNAEIDCSVDTKIVEVWFGEKIAPGFFAWVIPISEKSVRVGLASSYGNSIDLLKSFIQKRFSTKKIINPQFGLVLTDGPLKKTSYNGMLLVGDAAGHIKPTTGGGVILGGLCAIEAGKIAVEALTQNDSSGKFLKSYDVIWRKKYEHDFKSMLGLRRIANKLSDDRINRAFSAFAESGLDNILQEFIMDGDMDLQEGIIRQALSDPRIIGILVKGLGKLALSELLSLVNL